jgi:hypothetical protein
MEETYKLPSWLLTIGIVIAAALLLFALTRAYMRSRAHQGDTTLLDKGLLFGSLALGGWVLLTVLWILVDEPDALLLPVKIMGVTGLFFAIALGAVFAISFVLGRLRSAARR